MKKKYYRTLIILALCILNYIIGSTLLKTNLTLYLSVLFGEIIIYMLIIRIKTFNETKKINDNLIASIKQNNEIIKFLKRLKIK